MVEINLNIRIYEYLNVKVIHMQQEKKMSMVGKRINLECLDK